MELAWNPLYMTSFAATIAVNGLVTGLIVFRILKVFMEVKAATTSVERTLDSTGGTKLRHIIFVISNPVWRCFSSKWFARCFRSYTAPGRCILLLTTSLSSTKCFFFFNVIIRSVHFYFFCFTENFTWLGNHTNNNFGAGVNEIVLRQRRILEGSCRKSSF